MLRWVLHLLFLLLTVVAILAMAYAQYGIRIDPEDMHATVLLLIAALVAAILLGRQITAERETTLEEPPSRSTLPRLAAAAGILLSLFLVVAASVLLAQDWRSWFAVGWLFFGLGATGLSASLRLFDPPRGDDSPWSRPEILALIALVFSFWQDRVMQNVQGASFLQMVLPGRLPRAPEEEGEGTSWWKTILRPPFAG